MLSDQVSTLHPASGGAMPSQRVRVLTELLERYHDLVDPLTSAGIPGDGATAGILLMPATYTASVRELERLIRLLRDDHHGPIVKWTHNGQRYEASPRRLWWHLNAYYIDVVHVLHVPSLKQPKNKRKQLRRAAVDQDGRALPQVRVLRKAEARYPIALKALEHIAEAWSLPHEPMLPRELAAHAA